jgi:heptosyltransferase-3
LKKIAIVTGRGLGDGLVWLTLSYHLQLVGHDVTTFNTLLCQLKKWFPGQTISPFPEPYAIDEVFGGFDQILSADHSMVTNDTRFGEKLVILRQSDFNKKQTFVENLFRYCQRENQLTFFSLQNGLRAKKGLEHRKHLTRVVIHPTSSTPWRCWPKKKFLEVASLLKMKGFTPTFAMSSVERKEWEDVEKEYEIPCFSSLDETASYIYESGFFLGNNSGLGHLASNLQIPSISLFPRMSHSRLWRPGWGLNDVVTPLPLMIGAPLKHKYWKELLPVWKVMKRVKVWEKELLPSPNK